MSRRFFNNLSEEEKIEFAAEFGLARLKALKQSLEKKVTVVDYDYCQLLPTDHTTVVSRKG